MSLRERFVGGMRVIVGRPEELAAAVAERIVAIISAKPNCTLMFPTGATPELVYAALVSRYRRRPTEGADPSWSRVRCFNLDEYWGLPPWNEQSYAHYMRVHLYDWVDVSPANVFGPDSMAPTEEEACEAYERQIADCGGIDHAFLGIGVDGHIAFNEAGHPRGRTQVIELSASTIQANQGYFDPPETMPRKAMTVGIDTILASRSITLLATGSKKASAVNAALTGEVGPGCPASFLREVADRCIFYVDDGAASLLS